jgi:hypothetical protein
LISTGIPLEAVMFSQVRVRLPDLGVILLLASAITAFKIAQIEAS